MAIFRPPMWELDQNQKPKSIDATDSEWKEGALTKEESIRSIKGPAQFPDQPETFRLARRASRISQALRAIRDELDAGPVAWEFQFDQQETFKMRVALNIKQRERAYRLAYEVYRKSGYVEPTPERMIVSPFDADPRTLTLLVEDSLGRAAGTITLVFDSDRGLPCDELFKQDLLPFRNQGRRLVEVTRLAISSRYKHSKQLLVHLYNFVSIYARRVMCGTDFVIEVNPRHVKFYARMLLFSQITGVRTCLRVNGAPAVLLRLDLARQVEEIRHVGGAKGKARGPHGKSFYSYFQSLSEEHFVAGYLESQHRPISAEEMRYFGLDQDQAHDLVPCQAMAGSWLNRVRSVDGS